MTTKPDKPNLVAATNRRVLVVGDIVVDHHLYGGIKTAATSLDEPGTLPTRQLGGACLSVEILKAAADAERMIWDKVKGKREQENKAKKKETSNKGLTPCPTPLYGVDLGIDNANLLTSLPENLHSFGVWTPHSKVNKSNDRVWRVRQHFGYGNTKSGSDSIFARATNLPAGPTVVLLDDGAIHFRYQVAKDVWPQFSANGSEGPIYLLKMSSPLCCGDLWPALIEAGVANRLVVLVSADDLRRQGAQIRRWLSWEQYTSDTLRALREHPTLKDLLLAKHVVVNFRSAGALWLRRRDQSPHTAKLIYDPLRLEGDFKQSFDGSVYGFQTCVAAGIAHHLAVDTDQENLEAGIVAGLTARRELLKLGHGPVEVGSRAGFPFEQLGLAISATSGGYASQSVPDQVGRAAPYQWTILAESQNTIRDANQARPLIGLAQLTARYGRGALSTMPCLKFGNLFSVDRTEIESYRTLERLIRTYEAKKIQKKPLSIGVFGPPGAGKSFAVKTIAKAVFGKDNVLEFNLSQFKSPDELIGAFHRVRDEVLKGVTPVAFWDEFDSQKYKWLQYLLAPMQDGAFQEGQMTHPIGKCIFIFAGGTCSSLEDFDVKEPVPLTDDDLKKLSKDEKIKKEREYEKLCVRYEESKLLKRPDFVSRLHGHLNVLGPNPRMAADDQCPDMTWPIRRALMIRGVLRLGDSETLDIDLGLLFAMLSVDRYRHGSRSLEKILLTLNQDRQDGRLHRSALPPELLLNRETDAKKFHQLMDQRNMFKSHPDIERIAAAIHHSYLDAGDESQKENNTDKVWTVDPAILKAYGDLDADAKSSNRAAARRIPDHLALIDFAVVPQARGDDDSWLTPLKNALEKHLDRLAQAEHLGWCAERRANGWTYAEERNNHLKQHPSLVDWNDLRDEDKDKDRKSILAIPAILEVAKYKAVDRAGVTDEQPAP